MPTLEVPHLWEVSFQPLVPGEQGYLWRVPLLSAWSAVQSGFLPFMNCAYCSPGKVSLTSGSELRGKERQSYRSKKRFQMSIKQQAAAPVSKCHSPQKAGAWMEVNEGERALWGPDPSALPSNQSKAYMTPDHDLNSAAASGCNLETPTLHSR